MSDRASIGLDNPAFHGRIRRSSLFMPFTKSHQSSPGMTASIALSQSQTLISGLLTQPLFKPKQSAKLTPPDRARYKQPAEDEPLKMAQKPLPASIVEFRSRWDEPVEIETGPALSISAAKFSYKPVLQTYETQAEVLTEETIFEPQPSKQALDVKLSLRDLALPKLHFSKPRLPNLDPRVLIAKLRGYSKLQLGLLGMALIMFVFGITVSVMTLKTNRQAAASVSALSKNSANQPAATSSTATPAPSTVKPSSSAVSNYTVGPNMPRYLNIPKLGVHARVLSLGILNNGALATPNNVFDVGWYNESSLPGQPGAMLIDGHVSSWTSHGVFYGIKNLSAGDMVQIERGDGTVFSYQVVKTQVYDHSDVDMQSAVTPVDPTKPGLNLITCTGDVIKGTNEFNERVVVYTKQV